MGTGLTMPRKYDQAMKDKAVTLYKQGVAATFIAERLNVPVDAVRKWLTAAKVTTPGRPLLAYAGTARGGRAV